MIRLFRIDFLSVLFIGSSFATHSCPNARGNRVKGTIFFGVVQAVTEGEGY